MSKLRKKTLGSKIARQQLQANTGLAAEAMDAFTNVAARMGYGTSSLAEATEYELVRWTNNYWLMITLFRNHWISRRIVEKPAQDMCKAWPVINSTELKPDQINDFKRTIDRTYTPSRIREAITWARLFGGAGALIVIDGHEGMLDKPLRLDDVNPGSYKGLIVFDRWSGITPSTEMCDDINSPVDFNLPVSYTVQGEDQGSFQVHHSRILRFTGPQVPRPENQAQMHWGISELEIAYEEIRKRDNASWSILSLMFRAQILAQKNPQLASMLSGAGASKTALQQFQRTMQAQNELMSNQSMLLMGADSELQGHAYAFSGISDVYQQFQMDTAGAAKMPVSILFGRTVTGLSQGNDADIRIYEQDIAQKQHEELRPQLDKLYPVICMSEFGEVPDDLDMTFPSIRVLTEEQKTENAAKITEAVLKPYEAGITGPRLTLQELQAQSEVTGIFTNITPEMIEKASDEPIQPMLGMEGEGDNEGGEGNDAEFKESDHPRDESGKFSPTSKESVAASNNAYSSLPISLQNDLDTFLAGTTSTGGRLDNHFKENNEHAKAVYEAYEPVRRLIKEQVGNTIPLYRFEPKELPKGGNRSILSFADGNNIRLFASGDNLNGKLLKVDVPVDDIVAVPTKGDYYEYIVKNSETVNKVRKGAK